MDDNFGYCGEILRVDLSSGTVTRTPTADYAAGFLGGRGLAARIYWAETSPDVTAFDPKNPLIFVTGPNGVFAQTCQREPANCVRPPSGPVTKISGFSGSNAVTSGDVSAQ